jgi:serine/threonine protein kinase
MPSVPQTASRASAADQDYPLGGETLGLWRLVRGLGRGGMGEVYEAEYDYVNLLGLRYSAEQRPVIEHELRNLGRVEQSRLASEMLGTPLPPDARFAIKICNARSGTAGHRRFLQEAEVAQRLGDHPYIVTIHAVNAGDMHLPGNLATFALERGKYRDVAFMVMDLAVRDYDHTKLTIEESVHVVRCIGLALDHAHAKGVVHRDLKPENILGSVEHPLLTDFGIAKELDQSDGLTRTGQIIGTLDYMSPEQATDAKRVDHRSDIYSLGVVLYEMTTSGGLPYFHKADRESCLAAIRSERVEPRWPREHVPGFPVGLERIVLKAMAYRQEDRYQAMSELIGDLDRWGRGEWIPPWGHVGVRNWTRYQLRRHPKAIWGSLAGSALVLITVLVLVLLPYLDTQRQDLEERLRYLEQVVVNIEAGRINQPGPDDVKKTSELDQSLTAHGNRYPDQLAKREQLQRRLLASRRLVAYFAGRGPGGRAVSGDDAASALEQLKIAGGAVSPYWLLGADGLQIQDHIRFDVGPYGTGAVRISIALRPVEGLAVLVHEVGKLPHHQTLWLVQGGMLQQHYREDEKPGQLLAQDPAPPLLLIEAELRPDGIRMLSPRRADQNVRGLDEGAGAVINLDLPRNTVIQAIDIRPLR